MRPTLLRTAAAFTLVLATPALAQETPPEAEDAGEGSWRTRVGLGPAVSPKHPGSDEFAVRPLIEFSRAREGNEFAFDAADDGLGIALIKTGGLSIGPLVALQGEREIPAVVGLPKIDLTVEVGASVQYVFGESFRLRAQARRGVNGHEGWVGMIGADYVARDGDNWLFSIGPRATFSDDNYQRAYFDVSPAVGLANGLPAYVSGGGLQAVGATASYLRQLGPRFGVYAFGKYDRLVDDPSRSPLVRVHGSRDQFGGGIALTYIIGPRR